MLTQYLAWILVFMQSPVYQQRERASRQPWLAIAIAVPVNHPDAEVRLRRRKAVPRWYQVIELNPWFLTVLRNSSNDMYARLWSKEQKNREALFYIVRDFGLDYPCLVSTWSGWAVGRVHEVDASWCYWTLVELRKEKKEKVYDEDGR